MDAKELLKQKGEMIALGVAVLILVGYAVVAYGMGGDADLDAVKNVTTSAEAKIASNPAPTAQKPDFSPLTKQWKPDAVSKPDGKGNWVAMFKPTVVPNKKKGTGEKKPVVEDVPGIIMTPVMDTAETELGQVTVKWKDGKKPGEKAAAIHEYHIFRQESGKDWAPLEKVPATRKSHVDRTVEPKKKYAYRVKASTKEKTKDGKQESDFSSSVEATVPSGTAIVFKGGSTSLANITVRKFMGGDWKERAFYVKPKNEEKNDTGEIGGVASERNTETNKMEKVDYKTGFILLEVKKDRYKYKRTVRNSKIVEGELVTEETEEDAEKDRLKIVFLDDEGKQKEMWMADDKEEGEGE